MRGFLGFPLEAGAARALAAFGHARCAKPALAEDLHLTIKFLSEFSSDQFVRVLPELAALGPAPLCEVSSGCIERWPTAIVLLCEADAGLAEWHQRVNALLEKRGFLHERHPAYRPHITLGRGEPRLAEEDYKQFLGMKIALRPPVLYRSQPLETGRRHHEYLSPLF